MPETVLDIVPCSLRKKDGAHLQKAVWVFVVVVAVVVDFVFDFFPPQRDVSSGIMGYRE